MCKIISRINDNWQSYLSQAVLVSKLPYRYKARNKKAPTIGWNFVSCDLICQFLYPLSDHLSNFSLFSSCNSINQSIAWAVLRSIPQGEC